MHHQYTSMNSIKTSIPYMTNKNHILDFVKLIHGELFTKQQNQTGRVKKFNVRGLAYRSWRVLRWLPIYLHIYSEGFKRCVTITDRCGFEKLKFFFSSVTKYYVATRVVWKLQPERRRLFWKLPVWNMRRLIFISKNYNKFSIYIY